MWVEQLSQERIVAAKDAGAALLQSISRLTGARDATQRRWDVVQQASQTATSRIALSTDARSFIELLAAKQHEAAVGNFERLLTAILDDVLGPGREVVMQLGEARGGESLDILLRKQIDNLPHEALRLEEITAGSVTGVVSAGLRLVTLLRSGLRPFIVLDEADCWVRPNLAGRFAATIAKAVARLGIQTLMISHLDESFFEGLGQKLTLIKGADDLLLVEASNQNEPWPESEEPPTKWHGRICSIRLDNFRTHKQSLLPLGPGFNLLCGDNDIGKSSVVAALRAMFLGEGNDSVIRHGQKSTSCQVEFEDGSLLTWTRSSGSRSKETWKLLDNEGKVLHETSGGRKAPDWILPETGIGLNTDLDIQLRDQREPIFLLNRPGRERALTLSVGRGADIVRNMLELDHTETRQAQTVVKTSETELESMRRQLLTLDKLPKETEWLAKVPQHAVATVERVSGMTALTQNWQRAERMFLFRNQLDALPPLPQPPSLHAEVMKSVVSEWKAARAKLQSLRQCPPRISVSLPEVSGQADVMSALSRTWGKALTLLSTLRRCPIRLNMMVPVDNRSVEMRVLVRQWSRLEVAKNLLQQGVSKLPVPPNIPVVGHGTEIFNLATLWQQAIAKVASLRSEAENLVTQSTELQSEIHALSPVCPTCLRPWEDDTCQI